MMGSGAGRRALPACGGLVLGLLAIGPGLAPGYVLSYDMVFVPHPSFTKTTFGLTGTLPRAVPSDAVVTALSTLVPGDIVQKVMLLAIFVMACASAARLVPSQRLLPRLAAGVAYAWNPFVAERLLLGQWALLLGYAALPWVVAAARGSTRRLLLALVPAAIGGFAALTISALVAVIVATTSAARRGPARHEPGRAEPAPGEGGPHPARAGSGRPPLWLRRRAGLRHPAPGAAAGWAAVRTSAVLVVASLPWLVPSLLRHGGMPADPVAVSAFAARADTGLGTVGSLLLLGGGWNGETVPAGYGSAVFSVGWLCVVVLALLGYFRWRRTWPGLGVAGVASLIIASLGAIVPGVLRSAIDLWPGFAVFRDGQQFVAPLAVVVAVGLGAAVDRVLDEPTIAIPLSVLGLLAPVVLLPGLAWGASGRLTAVSYPSAWNQAKTTVDSDHAPGDVLVLPWAAYRGYRWNGGRRVLDPLPRFLHRHVVLNDAATVTGAGEVRAEDPRVRRLDPLIGSNTPLTGALASAGIRYVVVDDTDTFTTRLAGAARVMDSPDLAVYRIDGTKPVSDQEVAAWPVAIGWIVTIVAIICSLLVPGITLDPRSPPPSTKEP